MLYFLFFIDTSISMILIVLLIFAIILYVFYGIKGKSYRLLFVRGILKPLAYSDNIGVAMIYNNKNRI